MILNKIDLVLIALIIALGIVYWRISSPVHVDVEGTGGGYFPEEHGVVVLRGIGFEERNA